MCLCVFVGVVFLVSICVVCLVCVVVFGVRGFLVVGLCL
jgi:hypothetical protein